MALTLQRLSAAFLRLPVRMRFCSTSASDLHDLVIVGAGIEGSAMACSIGYEPSLSHRRVLLLDSAPSPPRQVAREDPYSNRVSVLSPGTVDLLKKINAWDLIEGVRATPFTQLNVWDACSDARVVFNRQRPSEMNATGEPRSPGLDTPPDDIVASSYHSSGDSDDVMGYIVENRVVTAALTKVLEGISNVEVQRGVKVKEIQRPDSQGSPSNLSPWVEVVLDNGNTVSTRLLVGSDGPASRVRQLCGFQQVGWNYDQAAIVATLQIHQVSNNCCVWQRFLPTGPIAMLPLSSTHCSLLWSTSPTHSHTLLEMEEERFVDAVNAAFCDTLPQNDFVATVNEAVRNAVAVLTTEPPPPRQLPPTVAGMEGGSRAIFPLALGHAPLYVKPRVALVGDTAHRVHPLAGQWVSLGLGDVATLTSCLLKASSRGTDWGSLPHLLEYETTRQCHNVPKLVAIDSLKSLFSTSWAPAVLLRSLGFHLTNSFPEVKEFLMEQAQKAG